MLLALTLLAPLVAVVVIALAPVFGADRGDQLRRGQRLRRGAVVASPAAVLPAVVLTLVSDPAPLQLPWLLFGIEFSTDPDGRALTLIAALLYGAGLIAVAWLRPRDADRGPAALNAFLLVCFTGNIGTYLAADAASFYLSFTLMSFAAVGLVVHYRHAAAQRATVIYLVVSVLSETALLAGLVLTVSAGGYALADAPAAIAQSPNTGLIVTLLLIGFGVKAGTVPLHVWLPLAHPAAPPAASAVLSGAMVKAGVIGWLRFMPNDGGAALTAAGTTLLVLALLGAFAAAVVGVLQQDPKVILAYSTVSQMGFIAALVAVAMMDPELAPAAAAAAVLYCVHHGLAKGALFLGVPVVEHFGRGVTGVVVIIGMASAGLALAGAPLTAGAYAKYVSKEAATGATILGVGLEHLLPLVATGSIVLLMRFAVVMHQAERRPRRRPDGELLSWLAVCIAGAAVPWWVGENWISYSFDFSWSVTTVWEATWPILLGFGLGGLVWWVAARGRVPAWLRAGGESVAPGDLIVAEESVVLGAYRGGARTAEWAHRVVGGFGSRIAAGVSAAVELTRRAVSAGERRLGSWEISGAAILALLLGVVVLLLGWGWLR